MLYAFTEMESFSPADLVESFPLLSEQRKALVNRRKFFKNKRESALAYLLLRYALAKEFEIFESVHFDFGKFGKPFLRKFPEIHFNLSHSNSGVLCGISAFPVGVDIADADIQNLDLIPTALYPSEQAVVQKDADPARAFARFWALKESFLKFQGTGISENIASLDFSKFKSHSFVFEFAHMQIWNIQTSVIACSCVHALPLRFIQKSELFPV